MAWFAMSASLHFAKISLHFPKMQGETGSFADTARLIYLASTGGHPSNLRLQISRLLTPNFPVCTK
jgi:hypothetical protein